MSRARNVAVRHCLAYLIAITLAGFPSPASAAPCWNPPVAGRVVDPFRMPACTWCPGNRGIEYEVGAWHRGAVGGAGLGRVQRIGGWRALRRGPADQRLADHLRAGRRAAPSKLGSRCWSARSSAWRTTSSCSACGSTGNTPIRRRTSARPRAADASCPPMAGRPERRRPPHRDVPRFVTAVT